MKRFLVYSAVVVALAALTGPAMAQYSTGTTNTTNQNMTNPPTSSTTNTTAPSSTATQSTVDQSTNSTTSTTTDNNMPRTASPLPLIAMSGILTLIAGMWISRRRRSA